MVKNSPYPYCTPEVAAGRLGVDLDCVWQLLEQGDLPALLPGHLRAKDGTSLGFGYALLPPELVGYVLHQGGHGIDEIEWPYALGNAIATTAETTTAARKDSIRVLWEPSLFPDLIAEETVNTPPTASQPASDAPGKAEVAAVEVALWNLVTPKKWDALARHLYAHLLDAPRNEPRPSANAFLVDWRMKPPVDLRVLENSVEFDREHGGMAALGVRAIQARIDRMAPLAKVSRAKR